MARTNDMLPTECSNGTELSSKILLEVYGLCVWPIQLRSNIP